MDTPFGDDDRGLTPIVAVALLIGMIAFSATLVVISGSMLIDDIESSVEMEHAESSMEQTQSELHSLAQSSDDDFRTIDLETIGDGDIEVVDDGTMTFYVNYEETDEFRHEMDVGTMKFETDGESVAYQAGGVWRGSANSATVVSPPDITYRTEEIGGREVRQLSFPVANIAPEASTGSGDSFEARVDDSAANVDIMEKLGLPPAENEDLDRVRSIKIVIENNDYSDAWANYFESEFGAEHVETTADTVTVTAPLGSSIAAEEFLVSDVNTFGAMHSSANFDPNTLNQVLVDGYDSTTAPYDAGPDGYDSQTGQIVSEGEVKLTGNMDVYGDVWATGPIDVPQDGGNNQGQGNNNPGQGNGGEVVYGSTHENETDLPSPDPVDDEIETVLSGIETEHNNEAAAAIEDQTLSIDGTEHIGAGIYHLDELVVEADETLVIDTSDGDIALGVDTDVTVEEGGAIEVIGEEGAEQLRVFSGGDIDVSGEVTVTEDRSYKNFWYAQSTASVTIEEPGEFTGLLYAPGAEFTIDGQGSGDVTVYGSLVGDFDASQSIRHLNLHYDNALHNIGDQTTNANIDGDEIVGPTDPELTSFDAQATVLASELRIWNGGDYRSFPIGIDLVTTAEDGDAERVQPWPETDLHAEGFDGAHPHDLNHPATADQMTYEFEDLDPGSGFAVDVEWRQGDCVIGPWWDSTNHHDSFADTYRTISGDDYPEYGCSLHDVSGHDTFTQEIEFDPDEENNRYEILADGDEVPEITPLAGQPSLDEVLEDRLDESDNTLDLDDNEFVIAFELGDANPTWEDALDSAPNELPAYNDVVMLYEITDEEYETADGEPIGPSEEITPADLDEDFGYTIDISGDQIVIDAN